ncbi:MAG: FIST C-terminal domain-containing protein [Candidatus Omnitrophica bacterium]|nr:FIST C-terminal domain-containing protein [Candidatus Omnitrophota bacterium]
MSTHIGIGFSRQRDGQQAAREAALYSKTQLESTRVDFALVLITGHYDPHAVLAVINDILRGARVIGSSTIGIILSGSVEPRGIGVLTITSDDIKFGIGAADHLDTVNTPKAGTELARQCLEDFGEHGRQIFLCFVDSRLQNVSPLIQSLQASLGNVFPVVGAGSCHQLRLDDTFQIHRQQVLANAVSGVVIGGHMGVGVGSQHGWRPLGKPRFITQASGNIIQTIDGKPAYSVYEEFFADEAARLRSSRAEGGQMAILYPLGIYLEESGNYLLRNAVDIRPDGSIVCQGNTPGGSQVHVMIGNKDSCKQAARKAAEEARQALLGKEPKLILVLDSMARLKLLGRMAFQEIRKIKEVFGPTVPIIGMYGNGEISPLQSTERFKRPHLQSESIVVVAIS